ncbi:MAG TPA: CrcB family protein [Candidatus Limnocylindrales bacterium]|nr:CrcB family protein [Candidatus Limnocylindrales bacterium]
MPIVLVALGGAAGAAARYLVDGWVSDLTGGEFPWGTLVVNGTGAFALGVLFALAIEADVLPASIRGPVMIGFIGAYTTFSTLMLESWRLWEDGAATLALVNVVGSVLVGVVAVVAGLIAGRAIA